MQVLARQTFHCTVYNQGWQAYKGHSALAQLRSERQSSAVGPTPATAAPRQLTLLPRPQQAKQQQQQQRQQAKQQPQPPPAAAHSRLDSRRPAQSQAGVIVATGQQAAANASGRPATRRGDAAVPLALHAVLATAAGLSPAGEPLAAAPVFKACPIGSL